MKGLTKLHPGDPRGDPRHLQRHRAPGDHRAPEEARRHGDRAHARAPVRQRLARCRRRACRTTGATTPIAFFAPQNTYSSTGERGQQVQEFKGMVRALHAAGIEVILDVVYNHTAEGNHLGPTLSMRGIDNAAYYRLEDNDKRYYTDYTGTGNSLNVGNPHALQLIMDSLRYWVLEMHVDGFRFDLAVDAGPRVLRRRPPRRPSSSSCSRTRWSRRSSSSPSRGTSAPAATRSATSPRSGPSGTASTATPCATSGAASRRRSASSPRG